MSMTAIELFILIPTRTRPSVVRGARIRPEQSRVVVERDQALALVDGEERAVREEAYVPPVERAVRIHLRRDDAGEGLLESHGPAVQPAAVHVEKDGLGLVPV